MPVIWDQQTYANAYTARNPFYGEPGETERLFNYGRRWAQVVEGAFNPDGSPNTELTHAIRMLREFEGSVPKFNRNSDVLVVGCGFGYTMEAMVDLGATSIWGTDISPYIQAEKVNESRADIAPLILDIDVTAPDAVAQFAAAGAGGSGGSAGKFHWVVTELVVESFDPVGNPAEFADFLDGLDSLLRTGQVGVAHILAGRLPPPYDQKHDTSLGLTWLSLEEWVIFRPAHYWIDFHDWRMLGGT